MAGYRAWAARGNRTTMHGGDWPCQRQTSRHSASKLKAWSCRTHRRGFGMHFGSKSFMVRSFMPRNERSWMPTNPSSKRSRWPVELSAFVATLLLSACHSSANAASADEDQLLAIVRTAVDADSIQPIRDIENQSIASSNGRAVRIDDKLMLELTSASEKVYQDLPQCRVETEEAHCQTYRLVAYVDRVDAILVAHFFYEDLQFILIDSKSGHETNLDGFPIFSPSGKYALVLVQNDMEVGSEIQIWERKNDTLSLAWQGAPNTDGFYTEYKLEDWQRDNEISIRSQTQYEPTFEEISRSIELHRIGGQWNMAQSR